MDRILIILKRKRKWPKGFICPCTGVKYHNIQTCLLVYAADLRCAFTGPLVLLFLGILGESITFWAFRELGAEENHFRELGRKVIFLSGSKDPPGGGSLLLKSSHWHTHRMYSSASKTKGKTLVHMECTSKYNNYYETKQSALIIITIIIFI